MELRFDSFYKIETAVRVATVISRNRRCYQILNFSKPINTEILTSPKPGSVIFPSSFRLKLGKHQHQQIYYKDYLCWILYSIKPKLE